MARKLIRRSRRAFRAPSPSGLTWTGGRGTALGVLLGLEEALYVDDTFRVVHAGPRILPPPVQLGEQLVAFLHQGADATQGVEAAMLKKFVTGDALVDDDMLREALRVVVGEGGQLGGELLSAQTSAFWF